LRNHERESDGKKDFHADGCFILHPDERQVVALHL